MKAKFIIRNIVKVLGFFLISSYVFMLVWNCTVPSIFNLPIISFLQALGLVVLCRILFKCNCHFSHHFCKDGCNKKWNEMSPEDRESFKAKWKTRCSNWSMKNNCDDEKCN